MPAFQQLLQLVLLFCQWSVLVLRSGSSFPCGTAQPQRKFRSLWAGPSHFAVSWPQARQRWHPPGRWQGAVARRGRSAGDEAKQSPSSSFLAQFQGQLCCRTRPSLLPAARWPGRGWRCRTGLQDVQGRLLSTTTVTSAWGSAELGLAQCLHKCFDSLQALGFTGQVGSSLWGCFSRWQL